MAMTMHTHLSPLLALIVGILILIFPCFLNYYTLNLKTCIRLDTMRYNTI